MFTVLAQLEVAYPPEHGTPHPLCPLHQGPRAPAGDLGGQVLLPPGQRRPDAPGPEEDRAAAAEPPEQGDVG